MAPLTPAQAQIIKATVPILAEHGNTITTTFYANLLRENPALNNIFNNVNQVNGHQPRALAGALYAYASNIDDLGALSPAVELICNKHASLYIRAEHYGVVATYLLAAMQEVLGAALTPDILDAWAAAYWQLANLMIGREKQLYQEADGWTDWRAFRIARKERESEEITSFYLEPVDGKKLPRFEPGQYISVRTEVPGLEYLQARQYSLSDMPREGYYRISVKKESGINMTSPSAPAHPGFVSNVLHATKEPGDVVSISHPYGDFHLPANLPESTPIVLISAGVGLTCLLSIFNQLTSTPSTRPIVFIHGARTTTVRAFAAHVRGVAARNANVRAVTFTSQPAEGEVKGTDYDFEGRIDLGRVSGEEHLRLGDRETRYFVCGPERFMTDVAARLGDMGVNEGRVHLELFGTGGVPKP